MEKQKSVAKSASHMGIATLMSRVLGLAREQVFAFLFGASDSADAFNIAFRIPNLLRDLFAEGAMSAAFVPNFTRKLVHSKKSAFDLLLAVLTLLLVGLSVLSVVGIVFSDRLVGLYASAYHGVPGKFELAVAMTRIMFPFFPLVAMAAVTMGALNALGFFFLPAFAPVLFNLASILAGLILCPIFAHYGAVPAIYGMAIGVVLGGFLQFQVQWWQMRKQGLLLRGSWSAIFKPWKVPGVRSVLWLLIPGTVGLAATQVSILINSIYATGQGSGAVSWLNYAFRLMQFPIGIFGVSLAAATLPQVSRKLAENDSKEAGLQVAQSLKMSFAVNGPAAVGLMAAGLPIIQMLFQHGHFRYQDSMQTASALRWYALGLPGYSAVKVLVPIFYALGSTRIPVGVSFFSVALNTLLNHIFLDLWHLPFWALALATAATSTLNAVILYFWLAKKLPSLLHGKVWKGLLFHGLVSGGIGGAVWLLMGRLSFLGGFLGWGAQTLAAVVLAGVIWVGLGRLFRVPEIQEVTWFLQRRFFRSK